jgi:signal transduction histidine kinase
LQVSLQLAGQTAQAAQTGRYLAARQEVGVALKELRDIAHGIHPAALTDGGLQVGLRTLAETSPVPLVIDGHDVRRYPAAVETAAYRLIADAVSAAGQSPSRASVTAVLSESRDTLRILLKIEGLDQAAGTHIVDRARDRIVALHGSAILAPACDEIMIEAKIPCAS